MKVSTLNKHFVIYAVPEHCVGDEDDVVYYEHDGVTMGNALDELRAEGFRPVGYTVNGGGFVRFIPGFND